LHWIEARSHHRIAGRLNGFDILSQAFIDSFDFPLSDGSGNEVQENASNHDVTFGYLYWVL
jgi:hypothetical protein